MSVRIQVTRSGNNKPVENVEVIVKWYSGISSKRTDSNGIADMGVRDGTAEYVSIHGNIVLGKMWMEDRIYSVSIP